MLRYLLAVGCLLPTGCSLLPEIAHQPTLHNPFPQLAKVAVAPFFNLSNESTLDGRQVAMAYFAELQAVPGFEVVPVNVVERAIQDNNIRLAGPADARRLAQLLGCDAVVIGAVTDFSPYYPPRCALQAEWYAANPNFHPIPPGYGLPWGTSEEEGIPGPLVFEAEMALAKAQLKTQTPAYTKELLPVPAAAPRAGLPSDVEELAPGDPEEAAQPTQFAAPLPEDAVAESMPEIPSAVPDWPDPRGFVPPPPGPRPPSCWPSDAPVMRHTAIYRGNDMEFTEALASYYFFQDEARPEGWQAYLQRSDDFLRFCCHMHIAEMLSARGGAGETRVVWRWPSIR